MGIKDDYLTQQEIDFCLEYVKNGGNGVAALLKAYPERRKNTTASKAVAASVLKKRPKIQAYLSGLKQNLATEAEKAVITDKMALLEGISSIFTDKDAKHSDRLRAAELLGRYYNLFGENDPKKNGSTTYIQQNFQVEFAKVEETKLLADNIIDTTWEVIKEKEA